jgi:putative sigma-54 modulation protein
MNITITGRHLEVYDDVKKYIEEKFSRIKRHFDHVIDAKFVLEKDHNDFVVKALLIAEGADFEAEEQGEDFKSAIDLLYDKLDRQVVRYKEKHWNKKHRKKE